MIYLSNSIEPQVIRIPRTFATDARELRLLMKGDVGRQEVAFDVADDDSSEQYYTFRIALLPQMQQGEWEYKLMDAEEVIASGLAVIGLDGKQNGQYQKNIEYEQYNG